MAILTKEADWLRLFQALNAASRRLMAAPNWLETCLVFDSRSNHYARMRLDIVVRDMRIDIIPFDAEMAEIARFAHHRYGRGSEHPAKLNYGDCMAYALAKKTREPLLFKGNDFIHTDIEPVVV